MEPRYKEYVSEVPSFIPRGAVVHIVIGGVEVRTLPVSIFLATADAAAEAAAEIRASGRVVAFGCRPKR